MPTEITHNEIKPGAVVVSVAGKLMIGSQGEQIVTLVENLLKEGKRTIIFNLGGVTTIDSTGIGHFIASFNKIGAAQGEMRLAGATPIVFHAFHVSLLDKVFRFFPTVEDASKA